MVHTAGLGLRMTLVRSVQLRPAMSNASEVSPPDVGTECGIHCALAELVAEHRIIARVLRTLEHWAISVARLRLDVAHPRLRQFPHGALAEEREVLLKKALAVP